MSTHERAQQLTRQVFALRAFYSALWGALDSLYPGYSAAAGGPEIKDAPSGLPKARMLLSRFVGESALGQELQTMLENDYARTEVLLAEYETLSTEQRSAWLQGHEGDRNHLLEETERCSRVLATPLADVADIIRQMRKERIDQIIGP